LLLALFAFNGFAQTRQTDSLRLEELAPRFVLRNLDDELIFLRDYCGQLRQPWKNKDKHLVILSFFTTYCKPCLKEIPQLETLIQRFNEKKLKIFLVNLKEDKALVKKYIAEKGFRLPVLLDKYGIVAQKYGVTSVPRIFLIDEDGRLIWMTQGYDPSLGANLTSFLEKHFRHESIP
jgi:thiol-disulfide isomerase/thioredoxin